MLCLSSLTRGRCPLRPPLLPERPNSTIRNGWGKFCSIEPRIVLTHCKKSHRKKRIAKIALQKIASQKTLAKINPVQPTRSVSWLFNESIKGWFFKSGPLWRYFESEAILQLTHSSKNVCGPFETFNDSLTIRLSWFNSSLHWKLSYKQKVQNGLIRLSW